MSDPFATKYGAVARPLYDKIINVGLYTLSGGAGAIVSGGGSVTLGNGQQAFLATPIICPPTGRKPTISLKGSILPSPILSSIELRITNFTTDIPLDQYVFVKIQAGYASALDASIEGEIVNAYQETPGPDGITVFYLMLGLFTAWNSSTLTFAWPAGTSINSILRRCVFAMGYQRTETYLDDSLVTQTPWSISGIISRFLSEFAQAFQINVYPLGQIVRVITSRQSTNVVHNIRYLKNPPRHDASGYNFVAPWDPSLRPNDIVQIATPYMRQTFGGAQVGNASTQFITQTINFDFSTTEDTNEMTVLATAAS